MGKWSGLKGHMKQWQPEEQDYKAKVNAEAVRITAEEFDRRTLAQTFADLKSKKRALEDEVSVVNITLAAIESIILEDMEGRGEQSFKLADTNTHGTGETFYIIDEPHAKIVDQSKLRSWCFAEGKQDLLTVNWQTLNSMCKERLEEGIPTPHGVDLFLKTKLGMRRS